MSIIDRIKKLEEAGRLEYCGTSVPTPSTGFYMLKTWDKDGDPVESKVFHKDIGTFPERA